MCQRNFNKTNKYCIYPFIHFDKKYREVSKCGRKVYKMTKNIQEINILLSNSKNEFNKSCIKLIITRVF